MLILFLFFINQDIIQIGKENKFIIEVIMKKEYLFNMDEKKVNYEVESLKIVYYDTQKKKMRIAIPDIFINDVQ